MLWDAENGSCLSPQREAQHQNAATLQARRSGRPNVVTFPQAREEVGRQGCDGRILKNNVAGPSTTGGLTIPLYQLATAVDRIHDNVPKLASLSTSTVKNVTKNANMTWKTKSAVLTENSGE